jgi:hypothetical protein
MPGVIAIKAERVTARALACERVSGLTLVAHYSGVAHDESEERERGRGGKKK